MVFGVLLSVSRIVSGPYFYFSFLFISLSFSHSIFFLSFKAVVYVGMTSYVRTDEMMQ